MLAEAKKALRITTTSFDDEILDLINAGVKDIESNTGAYFEKTVSTSDVEITDPLVKRAVITYCKCNFGNPDNYANLKTWYDEQKGQLRENSDYQSGGSVADYDYLITEGT